MTILTGCFFLLLAAVGFSAMFLGCRHPRTRSLLDNGAPVGLVAFSLTAMVSGGVAQLTTAGLNLDDHIATLDASTLAGLALATVAAVWLSVTLIRAGRRHSAAFAYMSVSMTADAPGKPANLNRAVADIAA